MSGVLSRPLITLARRERGPAAAQVMELVRSGGTAHREQVASRGGLSVATVRRATTSLLDAGVLRERCDLTPDGAVGRPSHPVEIDPDSHLVIGVTLSAAHAVVALGDLSGRVVNRVRIPRRSPGGDVAGEMDTVSRVAARLLATAPGRSALSVGLVAGWVDLGEDPTRAAAELEDSTGLPVRVGDPVGAAAAAEHFARRTDVGGRTAYVYAGDSVGWAMVLDRGECTEYFRGVSLAHFPAPSLGLDLPTCACGRTGCLAEAVAEDRFADRHAGHGEGAAGQLRARARVLGRVAAAVRDMAAPDRVILAGSAFTEWPAYLDDVLREFRLGEPWGAVPVEFARHGADESVASCTVALGPVFEDPLLLTEHLRPVARIRAV